MGRGRLVVKPLELILARSLLTSLSKHAFLLNGLGDNVFYDDAAGALLGRRFEEFKGAMVFFWIAGRERP